MFLLRARKPEVYSERYRVEHGGRVELDAAVYHPDRVRSALSYGSG
jgi:hypothetical protein